MGLNELKRRTMQVEAFGASSATIGRNITAEMLTDSLLGVPWSPWMFAFAGLRGAERDQERIDQGFGVGCWGARTGTANDPMTSDVCDK